MKKMIILLLTLPTIYQAAAQVKAAETDFILKAGSVYWQHVYNIPGKSAEAISGLLDTNLEAAPFKESYSKTDQKITFRINDDKPNIKKYGGKVMKTALIAQLYMKYDVIIDIVDNQYTVTVKNIFLDNRDATEKKSGDISKFACTTSNVSFKTDDKVRNGLAYSHRHLLEKYDVTAN